MQSAKRKQPFQLLLTWKTGTQYGRKTKTVFLRERFWCPPFLKRSILVFCLLNFKNEDLNDFLLTIHSLLAPLAAYGSPHFLPGPPQHPTLNPAGDVTLLHCAFFHFLRLLLLVFLLVLVQDPRCHQPLQSALVHPQLGSDGGLPRLPGQDGGVPAERTVDDRPPRQPPAQPPQAALAEAVLAVQLPRTAAGRVKAPVTDPALDL